MSDKSFDQNILLKEDDAKFIDLARNAFDVMMRRGWGVVLFQSGWAVAIGTEDLLSGLRIQRWADPFTALVEADLWYRKHVESGGESILRGD